jgi:hypothetical protein
VTEARLAELETACVDAGDSVVVDVAELRELLRIARGRRRLEQLDARIANLAANRDDSLVDSESL